MRCCKCCFSVQICEFGAKLLVLNQVVSWADQFRCVTMHESMHNRAADAEILRQLSKMKLEIHQLRNAGEFLNVPEASTSEQSLQPRQRCRLKGTGNLDGAMDNTIYSVEDFVEDSLSTVYARTISGSEASQSGSGDSLHKTSSKFCKAPVDYEDEYRPSLGMIKLREDMTVDHLSARIVNEEYDLDDLYSLLETLDESELQPLAFYASSNGLDTLLDLIMIEYDYLLMSLKGSQG
jgi:hypothetical protein